MCKSCSPPINCNRASGSPCTCATRALVLLGPFGTSFGFLSSHFGCTSPIYLRACVSIYILEIDLFLLCDHRGSLLAITISWFSIVPFAFHIPHLSTHKPRVFWSLFLDLETQVTSFFLVSVSLGMVHLFQY